jgi:hypothetical protein
LTLLYRGYIIINVRNRKTHKTEVIIMNKKELINGCIDMSYEVSKEDVEKAIIEITGNRYMQTKYPVKQWRELHDKLNTLVKTGAGGNLALFLGSNTEYYRQ